MAGPTESQSSYHSGLCLSPKTSRVKYQAVCDKTLDSVGDNL